MMKLQEGKIYKMGMHQGIATVKLHKVQTYPATGMPADLIFEYVEGSIKPLTHPRAKEIFGHEDRFPLPETMIPEIKLHYGIEEI